MLKEKVKQTIVKYKLIESGDKIVVGVSGGPDSISLINILIEIKEENLLGINFDLIVAHINHKIREEADSDQKFVEEYCIQKNIKCYVKAENVNKIAEFEKIGTEEAGRKLRYSFFKEILEKENANKIATAHTANDNAETILMNIIRGSGLSGLKGITPLRDKLYIRPLIDVNREEIEEYCKNNKLNPRIDKTNYENIYTRNKIRNILIPSIKKEFNPNIIETLNRLSIISREENEYFEKITKKTYKEILLQEENKKQIILDLKKFNTQESVIKSRIVLYTINRLLGNSQGIEKIHINDIIKLCDNNIGNKFLTPNKHIKILVKNKKIYFIASVNQPSVRKAYTHAAYTEKSL